MTLIHFMALVSFNALWKHQETSGFLMYFRKYRKKPVPWNGLKIFLTNMSAECWYSCLLHNRACFLTVDLHWFFQCTLEVENFNVFWFKSTSKNTWQPSWQPIETINCFYYSIYFTGSQLEQIIFFYCSIYFKLIKTNGLMYSLNESSFRMPFR